MANLKVERKERLTRQQMAQALSSIASALADGDKAELSVAGLEVTMLVPDELSTEFEIALDGDEIEIEVEMKWSTASAEQAAPAPTKAAGAARRRRRPT